MEQDNDTPLMPEKSQDDTEEALAIAAKTDEVARRDDATSTAPTGSPEAAPLYYETVENGKVSSEIASAAEEDKGLGAYEPIEEIVPTFAPVNLPESEVLLPPPESIRGAPVFSITALEQPGPATTLPAPEFHSSQNLTASPEMLTLLVTDRQMQTLWERLNQVQNQIGQKINSLTIARTLFDQIESARRDLLAGKDHYEEAERALCEVEYRLDLSDRVNRWSNSIGSWLVVYEVIWFIAAILGILFISPWFYRSVQAYSAGPASPTWPSELWAQDLVFVFNSMMWGILGGITGALYYLWVHISRNQDFDKQYSLWYLLCPVGGFVAGAFVFLVVRLGVFSLTSGQPTAITSPLIIYALAWMSGYQQNVVYDLVKRLLSLFKMDARQKVAKTG